MHLGVQNTLTASERNNQVLVPGVHEEIQSLKRYIGSLAE